MNEILKCYLKYIGLNDYEIENLDDVDIAFHKESKEFSFYQAGYNQAYNDLESILDRVNIILDKLELMR